MIPPPVRLLVICVICSLFTLGCSSSSPTLARNTSHFPIQVDGPREFRKYDETIIKSVRQQWYKILDASSESNQKGTVVIEFLLRHDGGISDLRVTQSNVSEALADFCSRAISELAPFSPWPERLRGLVGKDYRGIRFEFIYK